MSDVKLPSDTDRLDWLDRHCAFVADPEYKIGPFKIGGLRKMADAGLAADGFCMEVRPSDSTKKDWRIGLSAKVKYRTHELYYEPPHKIIDTFPSGYGGIVDSDGVLKLESVNGKVFLAPADQWQTA